MSGKFDSRNPTPITRADWLALLGGAAFAGALLAPLRHYVGDQKKVDLAKDAHDSFPISTYPMFSADRQGRQTIPHVVGFTADGQRVPLHYRHYGTGGLNQVRRQISRSVRRGDAADVAQHYADSLAAKPRTRERDVVEVAVVRSRFVFDDYFGLGSPNAVDTDPAVENVHARCPVGGRAVGSDPGRLPRQATDR